MYLIYIITFTNVTTLLTMHIRIQKVSFSTYFTGSVRSITITVTDMMTYRSSSHYFCIIYFLSFRISMRTISFKTRNSSFCCSTMCYKIVNSFICGIHCVSSFSYYLETTIFNIFSVSSTTVTSSRI